MDKIFNKMYRLSAIARDFNVGIFTIVEFFQKKGYEIDSNPNSKISQEMYALLVKEFAADNSNQES